MNWTLLCGSFSNASSTDRRTITASYLGETTAPTAEHLQGLLRPLTAYHYEGNPHPSRLAAIDHPRKARSYAYQSSPYTIDGIDEQGRNRNTTDWRFFYDDADRLVAAHGGLLQDRINTPALTIPSFLPPINRQPAGG